MARLPRIAKEKSLPSDKGEGEGKRAFQHFKKRKTKPCPHPPCSVSQFPGKYWYYHWYQKTNKTKVELELNTATQVPPGTQSMPQIIYLLSGTLSEVSVFSYLSTDKRIKEVFLTCFSHWA